MNTVKNSELWAAYRKAAARTEAIPNISFNSFSEPPTIASNAFATRLLHAVMGLVTESKELDNAENMKNFKEEFGDCHWYLPILEECLGVDLYALAVAEAARITGQPWSAPSSANALANAQVKILNTVACDMLDTVGKRFIIYGNPLKTDVLISQAIIYFTSLLLVGFFAKISLEETLGDNITKLRKRYPDLEFNSNHAEVRDVEKELSHITDTAGPSHWQQLIDGVLISYDEADAIGLSYQSSPEIVEAFILKHLQVSTKELANQMYGEALERSQTTIVHEQDGIRVQLIPFGKKPEPVHEDEEIARVVVEPLTMEALLQYAEQPSLSPNEQFNQVLAQYYTPIQIELIAMELASQVSSHYMAKGAEALARGYYSVGSSFSGRGNRLDDYSLYYMAQILAPALGSQPIDSSCIVWLGELTRVYSTLHKELIKGTQEL